MRCRVSGQGGAALIIVIGAIAALAVPAAALLAAAELTYAIESYSSEVEQVRALATGVRRQVELAVAAGQLDPPRSRGSVRVRNGTRLSDGRALPVGVFPRPPATEWPAVTGDPAAGGIGAEVELRAVVGPRGDARGLGGPVPGVEAGMLVDLEIEVWFRRAVLTTTWRYLWSGTELRPLD